MRPAAFNYQRSTLRDGLREFRSAIEAVDTMGEHIAGGQVGGGGGAHGAAGNGTLARAALHDCQGLADVETQ